MKADDKHPIIIKRKKITHGHHGGAWKIAFADFMTALMALFLVLWILSISEPETRQAVSEYFRTPLIVAMAGGDRNSASNSAITGGGPDPTYESGEVRNIDPFEETRSYQEREDLLELKRLVEEAISLHEVFKDIRDQIIIDLVPEGLRIQLVDSERRPMFEVGSSKVAPYMGALLRVIAPILNSIPNSIQLSGHTDSLAYAGGEAGYSNWELSADRANASRREMIAGGLDPEKLVRVSGMADKLAFEGKGPLDPMQRRIAIIVLDRHAKHRIMNTPETVIQKDAMKDVIKRL